MTALALAGTGGGAMLPDLVLPPGFDRVGDVVRFEQDPPPLPVHNPVGRPRKGRSPLLDVTGADLIPCTRCGLRGHVAGDPDRCLYYHGSLGLGGQSDQAGRAG